MFDKLNPVNRYIFIFAVLGVIAESVFGSQTNAPTSFVVEPRNVGGSIASRCRPFTKPQRVTLVTAKAEIQSLHLEFEGKKVTLHNLDLGTPSYRLIYAHDLDSGESVTIEFKGPNSTKKFEGNARVVIVDSNNGPKCYLTFRYSENL